MDVRRLVELMPLNSSRRKAIEGATLDGVNRGAYWLDAILATKLVSEATVADAAARYAGVPTYSSETFQRVSSAPPGLIPIGFAREHELVPAGEMQELDVLFVAVADPLRILAVDEIRQRTGRKVRILVAPRSWVQDEIEKYYHPGVQLVGRAAERTWRISQVNAQLVALRRIGGPPGANLLSGIQAVKTDGTSDVSHEEAAQSAETPKLRIVDPGVGLENFYDINEIPDLGAEAEEDQ